MPLNDVRGSSVAVEEASNLVTHTTGWPYEYTWIGPTMESVFVYMDGLSRTVIVHGVSVQCSMF